MHDKNTTTSGQINTKPRSRGHIFLCIKIPHSINKKKLQTKMFFRLVTSVGQGKKYKSSRGIEPQTFGFRANLCRRK